MSFYLDIYHRQSDIVLNEHGCFVANCSPGDIFLGLGNPNYEEYFGWSSKKDQIAASDFTKTHNSLPTPSLKAQKYLYKKRFFLSMEQYSQALKSAKRLFEALFPYSHLLTLRDAVDFVQSVYNAAKFPLHFTHTYSVEDIIKLPSLAIYQKYETFEKNYGSRENLFTGSINVSGLNKEEIACRLNIPVERIKQLIHLNLNNSPAVRLLHSFEVKLESSDFVSKQLVISINSQDEERQFETFYKNQLKYVTIFLEQQYWENYKRQNSPYLILKRNRVIENQKILERFIAKLNISLIEYNLKIDSMMNVVAMNSNNWKDNISSTEENFNWLLDQINSDAVQVKESFKYEKTNLISQNQFEFQTYDNFTSKFGMNGLSADTIMSSKLVSYSEIEKGNQIEVSFFQENQRNMEIESIKAGLTKNLKNSDLIAFKIIHLNELFLKKLVLKMEEVNEKLSGGEFIDIDSALNYIEVQISAHLFNIQKMYHSNLLEIDNIQKYLK